MISENAMSAAAKAADKAAFSRREDYTWEEGHAISAGDYKGLSTVAITFSDLCHAEAFVNEAMPLLKSLSGPAPFSRIVELPTEYGIHTVVIIGAYDLITKEEFEALP